MKNRFLATLSFLFMTFVAIAQTTERSDMGENLETGIDFLSVCVGIVIGIIVGFLVARKVRK